MESREVVIPKVWRSEIPRLVVFVVLAIACLFLTNLMPLSLVKGELFTLFGYRVSLVLPLFWFLPAIALASALYRIYNVRYSIDLRGIESRVGILSLSQSITRIRFEDIRSIETEQTLLERLLNVGLVEMGTAASAGLEMTFYGVSSPKTVQDLIQHERDKRLRQAQDVAARQGTVENRILGNE